MSVKTTKIDTHFVNYLPGHVVCVLKARNKVPRFNKISLTFFSPFWSNCIKYRSPLTHRPLLLSPIVPLIQHRHPDLLPPIHLIQTQDSLCRSMRLRAASKHRKPKQLVCYTKHRFVSILCKQATVPKVKLVILPTEITNWDAKKM